MPGIYSGGYLVREKHTKEGLVEAKEDANDPQVKHSIDYSHFGVRGQDGKTDFPEATPSTNDDKSGKKVPRPVIDEEFRRKREKYELFDAKTLYTEFHTAPAPMEYKQDSDDIHGMTPEETAHLFVSQNNCMFYHGYRVLDKADINGTIRTLYKLSNEDLQGATDPGGYIRGGYLKEYIVRKVAQADTNKDEWFQMEDESDVINASTRILPDQYGDLD